VTGEGYGAFRDPYVYAGSNVLKNKAGLRDQVLLEAFELEMTTLRAEDPLPDGRFGPAHYRAIHRHLFQDVYRWAGRYRAVRTSRQGHVFCFPERIDEAMTELFPRLQAPPFTAGASRQEFVGAAAYFLSELNAIHAFREGNGRSQLAFMHLVALRAGHRLDLKLARRQSLLPAMVASFGGDLAPLMTVLTAMLA
jgi:cell filamentation protein